jgi:hypothetical protein
VQEKVAKTGYGKSKEEEIEKKGVIHGKWRMQNLQIL